MSWHLLFGLCGSGEEGEGWAGLCGYVLSIMHTPCSLVIVWDLGLVVGFFSVFISAHIVNDDTPTSS